eukprot:scaffold11625_cov123-Isochrysis_galbana.AAC.7
MRLWGRSCCPVHSLPSGRQSASASDRCAYVTQPAASWSQHRPSEAVSAGRLQADAVLLMR